MIGSSTAFRVRALGALAETEVRIRVHRRVLPVACREQVIVGPDFRHPRLRLRHREPLLPKGIDVGRREAPLPVAVVLGLVHREVSSRFLEVGHVVAVERLIEHYLILLVLHLDLGLVETELLKQFQLLLLTQILIE